MSRAPEPAIGNIWSKLLRALGAQLAALAVLACVAITFEVRLPGWTWAALQAVGAMAVSKALRLGGWWIAFSGFLPFALLWQLLHQSPGWVYPLLLVGLALVFGGGLVSRVPLYNSNSAAWEALLELLPPEPARMADLGAGLGGPLAFLASRRPDMDFLGVEASPLVWLLGWLRTIPVRRNCRFRFGSIWKTGLSEFQVVYVFLSPVPMRAIWAKASREMSPGSLLVSHTFEVPDLLPERRIPLPGRPDACLLLYRIGRSQESAALAEIQ